MISNRFVGAAIFLIAAAYLLSARGYQASFGDILGPSAFPTLIAIPAMILSGLIALFPGGEVTWPQRHRILRQVAAVALLVTYGLVLQGLGFPIATAVLISAMAILMGGPTVKSLLLGVVAAPSLYVLFDRILGLPLDLLGKWFT